MMFEVGVNNSVKYVHVCARLLNVLYLHFLCESLNEPLHLP